MENNKLIHNYENYVIYRNGDVYNILRNKKLKPYDNSKGYHTVTLCNINGKNKHTIHRLVAQAFIPNPENKPCINHKNGIKTDNRIENLEWCTYSENTQHAFNIGLIKPNDVQKKSVIEENKKRIGINNSNSKKVRNNITGEIYVSIKDASIKLNFHRGHVYDMLKGRRNNLYKLEFI